MDFKTLSKKICASIIAFVILFQSLVVGGITINELKAAPPDDVVANFILYGTHQYINSDISTPENAPLKVAKPGAVYAIYSDNNTAQSVANNGTIITDSERGYVGQFTTQNDYVSVTLPAVGTYYVVQVSAADGTLKSSGIKTITVTEDNQNFQLYASIGHTVIEANQKHNKKLLAFRVTARIKDAVSSAVVHGAEFSVYEWSETNGDYAFATRIIDDVNGKCTIEPYTSRDGSLTTNGGYLYETFDNGGKFKIVETKAPENYHLDDGCSKEIEYTEKQNINHWVDEEGNDHWEISWVITQDSPIVFDNTAYIDVILHKNNENGNPMSNIIFNLVYDYESHIGTTDENGLIVWSVLEGTPVTLTEITMGSFEKDPIYDIGYDFTVGRTSIEYPRQHITVVNSRTANIKIVKKDEQGNYLQGAKYTIYDSAGNVAVDLDGNRLENLVTGADGTIKTGHLSKDTYRVVETAAPVGYNLNTQSFTVNFEDMNNNQLREAVVNIPAIKQTGTITVNKTDKYSGVPVGQASYKIFTKEAWEQNPVITNDNYITTITTNDNGVGVASVGIGEYYVVEYECPDAYALSAPYAVELVWDSTLTGNENTSSVVINDKEERATWTATINVKDGNTDNASNLLKDCEFVLYAAQNIVDINTGNTIAAGTIIGRYNPDDLLQLNITEMTEGDYAGHKIPYSDSYVLECVKVGSGYSLTIDNGKITLNANKNNGEQNSHVTAEFTIYRQSVELVLDVLTQSEGTFVPSKYNHIDGAAYNLYNVNNIVSIEDGSVISANTLLGTYQTDANGRIDITTMNASGYNGSMLPNGQYKLVQIKASVGYALDTTPVEFDASWSNTNTNATIAVFKQTNITRQSVTITISKKDIMVGSNINEVQDRLTFEGTEFELWTVEDICDIDTGKTIAAGSYLGTYEAVNVGDSINKDYKIIIDTINNGEFAGHKLPNGQYKLVEVAAGAGYSINPIEIIVDAAYEQDVAVTTNNQIFNNTRQSIVINLAQKDKKNPDAHVDTEYVSLGGARYELYNTSTIIDINTQAIETNRVFLGTYTTDVNGKLRIETFANDADARFAGHKIPDGSYELVEVQASKGYVLDNTPIQVFGEWNSNNSDETKELGEIVAYKDRQRVSIVLSRLDEKTGTANGPVSSTTLNEASYKLIAASDLLDIDTMTVIPEGTIVGLYLAGDRETSALTPDGGEGVYTFSKMHSSAYLDDKYDGHALPNGKYRIVEIASCRGYAVNDTPVEIDASATSDDNVYTVRNRIYSIRRGSRLILNKVTAPTNEVNAPVNSYITLQGAKYQLFNTIDIVDIDTRTVIPADTLLGEYVTDENGVIDTNTMNIGQYAGHRLPEGFYKMVEVEAPHGYKVNSTEAVFRIYTVVNSNDECSLRDASTYAVDDELYAVEVTKTATIEEEPLYASITINKVSNDVGFGREKLSDVGFKVYRFVDWMEDEGETAELKAFKERVLSIQNNIRNNQPISEDDLNLLLNGTDGFEAPVSSNKNRNSNMLLGDIVIGPNGETELFTDENGQIHTINLPYGEYFIVETTTQKYYRSNGVGYVFIQEDANTKDVTIENNSLVAKLIIFKVDTETGHKIYNRNVRFSVHSDTFNYRGGNDFKVSAVDTDNAYGPQGYEYIAEHDIVSGHYTIRETVPPVGYKPLEYPVELDFTANDGVSATINGEPITVVLTDTNILMLEIPNERIKNSQIKYEIDENGNEKPVVGAKMQIIKVVGDVETVVDEWITDKNPHVSNQIEIGNHKYILREVEAPAGYVKAADVEYVIDPDGENIIKMEDKYTTVVINSLDKETKENVVASFELKDEDGKVVAKFNTKDGSYTMTKLAPGKYTLTEKLPYGYQSESLDTEIIIKETADVQNFTVYNTETYGDIKIIKMGHEDKDYRNEQNVSYNVPLEGVEFTLYYQSDFVDANGKEHKAGDVVAVIKTDKNGKATIKNVPAFIYENGVCTGQVHYSLYETNTVENYELQTKGIEDFTFEYRDLSNSEEKVLTKTFNFTNNKPIISIEMHGTPTTFEGVYDNTNKENVTVVKVNDKLTYTITVNNIGLAPAKNVVVKDVLPKYLTFSENTAVDGITLNENNGTMYWTIDEIGVGQTKTITFTCTVNTKSAVDIVNKAFAHLPKNGETVSIDKVEYELTTDEIVYTTTTISYSIDKERLTDAPQRGTEDQKYGFKKDEVVTYKVIIDNLGTAELTMDVSDEFENPSYFSDIQYINVSGATWNNENLSRGTLVAPNITIEGGKTAVVMITAKVTSSAKQILANTMSDDKDNSNDGHVNIVTATNVTAKVYDGNGNEHILTKEDTNELQDKTAKANTPVQTEADGFDDPPVLGPDGSGDKWAKLLVVNFYSFLIIAGCVLYLIKTKKADWMKKM